MSKYKVCSRNEIIKFVHEVTGLEYSKCRARLKACGWRWQFAILPEATTKKVVRSLNNFAESVKVCAESVTKLLQEANINV